METERTLKALIEQVKGLDENAMKEAKDRQAYLAKPPGSLGQLEDISVKIAGITGKITDNDIKKQGICVMSSDNGVVEEGVASAPQSVTMSQTINFTRRYTGVSSMAKHFGIDLLVVDLGVAMDIPEELYTDKMVNEEGKIPVKIVDRKISRGTRNLAKEPAMTRDQAVKAVLTGVEAAKAMKDAGKTIFGVGEMGIGNTTTSSAVLGAITGTDAEKLVGRGGGLNDEGLAKKMKIVDDAIRKCEGMDILDILANVGGYDICAMAGAFIGAAVYRIPAVIDGFISIVAACAAQELCPSVTDFLFTSHKSFEIGYNIAIDRLNLKPMFDLGMRLGEGSGCPIAFNIIETACATMSLMKTLDEAAVDGNYLEEIRRENLF